ncbi:MAG TPA: glutamine-hydrolyzing GMP synthase [Candidatus Bilamarchaeum sp.]|nr:glutamine-hydrolyzing GMP synthase [Candidatus Bilamarchaeum sp.]
MILIIDNGGQYAHLIKRNCRELGYDCDMLYNKASQEKFDEFIREGVVKIILSGGPSSVYSDPPNLSSMICERARDGLLRMPILGICYGQQMLCHVFGAKVANGKSAEYGMGEIEIDDEDEIFRGVPRKIRAWVSHFDEAKELPKGFRKLAHSESCMFEAIRHEGRPIFGVQFHPEVWHTEHGEDIIRNFLEISGQPSD